MCNINILFVNCVQTLLH